MSVEAEPCLLVWLVQTPHGRGCRGRGQGYDIAQRSDSFRISLGCGPSVLERLHISHNEIDTWGEILQVASLKTFIPIFKQTNNAIAILLLKRAQGEYETTGLSFNHFHITHDKSKIHRTVQYVNSYFVFIVSLDQPIYKSVTFNIAATDCMWDMSFFFKKQEFCSPFFHQKYIIYIILPVVDKLHAI